MRYHNNQELLIITLQMNTLIHNKKYIQAMRCISQSVALLLFFDLADVNGASQIWDVDSNGDWTTDANWDGTHPDAIDDTATFDGSIVATTAARTITLDADITLGTLNIDDDHSISIGGANAFTFDVSGGNASLNILQAVGNGGHDIDVNIALNDDLDIDQASTDDLNINGDMSGNGGITATGLETIRLSGDNNYAGTTTVSSGTVIVNHLNALGEFFIATQTTVMDGAGLIITAAGLLNNENFTIGGSGSNDTQGALDLNGAIITTITGTVSLSSASTINVEDANGTLKLTNSISGSFDLTKTGAGTLELGGANSYDGDTILTGGILELGNSNRIADASDIKMDGGTFNTGGFSDTMGNITLSADSIIDMDGGNSILNFGVLDETLWTGTLKIYNWDGVLVGGGNDQLRFTDITGFDKYSQISFYSGYGVGQLSSSGRFRDVGGGYYEIVPTPEASTWVGIAMLSALIIWNERRRRKTKIT